MENNNPFVGKEGINVLSLFDGLSCGRLALEKADIKINNYFASENDKHCIANTQFNRPDTIQLGDICDINGSELTDTFGTLDLIIGGGPCQGFSIAGKGLNFSNPRSKLFFEYVRILREVQKQNPNVKFLFENVKMKQQEWEDIISEYLGVRTVKINSELVCGAKRNRLYWTNIDGIEQPIDKGIVLKDILETEGIGVTRHNENWKYRDKATTLDANYHKGIDCHQARTAVYLTKAEVARAEVNMKFPDSINKKARCLPSLVIKGARETMHIEDYGGIRLLTPVECERLQTLPDGWTENMSDTQRYKSIGNGWTVDVIAHIFSYLKK